MSVDFWNDRYSTNEFAYGTEPSALLQQFLPEGNGRTILFPAEGEGRNAVFAAQRGWDVTAFDQSEEGKKKAQMLARSKNVQISYAIETFESVHFPQEYFDALVLVFVHLPLEIRSAIHNKFLSFVKSGGVIVLESFSKKQLRYSSGGPKNEEQLYTKEIIAEDFRSCDTLLLEEKIVHLNEGKFHSGEASVIHFVGRKR